MGTGPSGTLTAAQERVLRSAGSFVATMPAGGERASTLAEQRLKEIASGGLSIADAMVMVDASEVCVRDRVKDRSLLAMRGERGDLVFPRFQFAGNRELSGWADVASVVPATAHLVGVATFMDAPHCDLTVGGAPMSPSEWLTSGRSPQLIIDLINNAYEHRT